VIRVLLCDDQDVVREGLRAILGTAPGFEVVGVAADGAEAVELVTTNTPVRYLQNFTDGDPILHVISCSDGHPLEEFAGRHRM
jgi:chemotaxis response regulator CheB